MTASTNSSTSSIPPTVNWVAAHRAVEDHRSLLEILLHLFNLPVTYDGTAEMLAVFQKIRERAEAAASSKPLPAPPISSLTLSQVFDHLIKTAHSNSVAKGFWKLRDTVVWPVSPEDSEIAVHVMLSRLMLIDTEVAEAAEAVREGRYVTEYGEDGKPEGVLAELADAVIRVFDLLGVIQEITQESFAEIIEQKLAYNTTRPMMHGKRA